MKNHRLNGGKRNQLWCRDQNHFPFLFFLPFKRPVLFPLFPYHFNSSVFYLPSNALFFMSHKRYFSALHRTLCHNPLNFLFHYCSTLRSSVKEPPCQSRALNINKFICQTYVTKLTNTVNRNLCDKPIFRQLFEISPNFMEPENSWGEV
jgi:hypothetical protein